MVEVKTEKSKETLPILITENKNTQPLLGLDWLDKLENGLQGSKKTNVIRYVEEDDRRKKIISEHEDLFKNNHTIKDLTIDIQSKKDVKPIQQKGRPVPIHFQKNVRDELERSNRDISRKRTKPQEIALFKKREVGQNCPGFKKT